MDLLVKTYENLTSVRAEFRSHIEVNKKDFGTIEYLLRSGRRKLETFQDPGIRNISK